MNCHKGLIADPELKLLQGQSLKVADDRNPPRRLLVALWRPYLPQDQFQKCSVVGSLWSGVGILSNQTPMLASSSHQ